MRKYRGRRGYPARTRRGRGRSSYMKARRRIPQGRPGYIGWRK